LIFNVFFVRDFVPWQPYLCTPKYCLNVDQDSFPLPHFLVFRIVGSLRYLL
jgi:hypothetical protein